MRTINAIDITPEMIIYSSTAISVFILEQQHVPQSQWTDIVSQRL